MRNRIPATYRLPHGARQTWLAMCVGFLILSSTAFGEAGEEARDVVLFQNGDRISGHFKTANRDSINFSGRVTGDLSLSWKDIQELTLASDTMVIITASHPEGARLTARRIEVEESALNLIADSQDSRSFAISDLVSLAREPVRTGYDAAHPAPTARYSGRGSLEVSPDSLVWAIQKQISLGGVFDFGVITANKEAFRHQETTLATEANYSDSRKPDSTDVITELYSGTLQHNVYLKSVDPNAQYSTKGPYLYGLGSYYHNLSQGRDLVQEYGGGIGWGGKHGHNAYSLAVDTRYLNERLYSPGKSLSGPEAGITEEYSFRFKTSGIILGQQAMLRPVFNDAKALRIRGKAFIDIPIDTRFSFGVNFLDDYLGNAPPKFLPNYAKLSFDFKYAFPSK